MPRTRAPAPVTSKPPARAPSSGKRSHDVRGTAAQRREFYESFRAHTDEVRERLLEIIRDDEADHGHVISAAKEILSRGWGGVPQIQVIEAALKHEHSLSVDRLKGMSPADLQAFEAMLARLVEVDDAEVIDATPVADSDED
jgi:hypothetical protein